MSIWHIYGGNRLTGSTRVQGAKNAVLPIMAASVLAGSETVLHNVPDLKDVTITLRILRHLGCTAERDGDTVRIDSRGMNRDFIPHDLMRELRSSVIFLGAILARFGTANLRAIANTACRACDRFQLAQPEVRHNVAQDINILAHGRFGRPEEVAKIGKREDTVRLGGKNLHHSAHALVAADFVHGGIAPLSVVECESRCT